ncbi:MAG: glycosyl transferase [Akkermansiaceae bacterium]|nr:glycosyl transferase [Akkermansiaceae bacterium]
MIPKTIHYCWFGGKPMPKLALTCIHSWRKYCPEYELKLWDESNFDLSQYPYAKEAYEAGKYAFVTDVVRLHALYYEGGIYMDTDVEVLKSLDEFLHHHAFSGFESETQVPTGIMASEKGGRWAKENLEYYEGKHFRNPDGTIDITTNVVTITEYMVKQGLQLNNTYQDIEGFFTMYPRDYFCPKDFSTQEINVTDNTACIHHFNMSWHSAANRRNWKIRWFFQKYLGKKFGGKLGRIITRVLEKISKIQGKKSK